jgi:hypothetical protein
MLNLAADSGAFRARCGRHRRNGRSGVDDRRARLLHLQQQVGHAVLQRLEAANGHAKLLAGAQVLQRLVLGHVHGAQAFGRQRQQRVAADALQHGQALALGAQQRICAHGHVGEGEFCRAAAVDAAIAPRVQARRVARHQEQADAVFILRARGAGRHQQQVGRIAHGHHGLGAVQHPAICVATRRLDRRFGAVVATCVNS